MDPCRPKPWVALKNSIYHSVPYNTWSKLFVHHNFLGSIFLSCIVLSFRVTSKTKLLRIFHKNSIFSETIGRINKPEKPIYLFFKIYQVVNRVNIVSGGSGCFPHQFSPKFAFLAVNSNILRQCCIYDTVGSTDI